MPHESPTSPSMTPRRSARTRRPLPALRAAIAIATAVMIAAGSTSTAAGAQGPGKSHRKAKAPTHLTPAELAAATATAQTKTFTLSKLDKQALKNRARARTVAKQAEQAHAAAASIDARIARIDELLSDAAGDELRLRSQLEASLIAEYKSGDASGFSFILGADGLSDAVDRASLLKGRLTRNEAMAAAHEASLQRLQELRLALQELSDVKGQAAAGLDERVTSLNGTLVAAREAHVNEVVEIEPDAGTPGTWYVLGNTVSSAVSSAWSGAFGASYGGGTRTPARPATPEQITKVLADSRIQIYAGGISDIQNGRVDGRLLDALEGMADQFGSIAITSLITGHGTYTASGNISEHSFGCAADIGSVSGIRIEPSTQGPGTITETAVKYLSGLQGDLAPHQVISLYSYGGASMALADHYDHIHLGYSCS